jgi:hypothetical protein
VLAAQIRKLTLAPLADLTQRRAILARERKPRLDRRPIARRRELKREADAVKGLV